MRRHGAIRAVFLPLEGGAQSAATGQFKGNAQLLKALCYVTHNGVGETGGAGDGEHLQQYPLQVIEVGFGNSAVHKDS